MKMNSLVDAEMIDALCGPPRPVPTST